MKSNVQTMKLEYEIKCPSYENTIVWRKKLKHKWKVQVKLNLEIMKTWIWNLKCWKSKLNEKNCNLVHHIYYQIKNYFQINKEVDYNGAILKMAKNMPRRCACIQHLA
jgi:hypothetical protein